GAFLPLYFVERGASLAVAGASVSVFLFSGALGGIVGGHLSDRFGRRTIILGSLAGAFPCLILFFASGGLWKVPWLVLSGALIFTSMSVIVAQAQEMFPANAALTSSLMLGVAWFSASLVLMGIGVVADWAGLGPTLSVGIPLAAGAAAALAATLPREEEARPSRGVAA
ncbi:MAG: MFS transporter, partial [Nitrospinota bacterium]